MKNEKSNSISGKAFQDYFNELKAFSAKDATEHTLRPALHNLLVTIAKDCNSAITVIPEPKRDESGLGAPDVKFKIGGRILGYLENKKIEADLDQLLGSKQVQKYKKLSDNLVLTNYIEWIWLRDGKVISRETFVHKYDVGNHKAHFDSERAQNVGKLIANFLSIPPKGIARVKDLAIALATRCHDLREFLKEELIRQENEHEEARLYGLFKVFKKDVFQELDLKGFADAFAQMLGYGLFLSKINNKNKTDITLANAKQYIPSNFALIRELVNFLDEMDKPEYSRIRWLIEEILSLMNTLNMTAIASDLSFVKQGTLWTETEEERLLFAKDPYVYFYEDFLKAYDKDMRKSRGVYYTPPPVVNFIIRAINDILESTFGIKKGLADRKRVTVLDFATGTGTFLREVFQQVLDVVPNGLRDDFIRLHALKNFYGFEYLIAPYTIAHLKLSQFLHDAGFEMQPNERLQVYLTNTLEPIESQGNLLLPELTREVERAQKAKERAILVITGNPPYAGHSKNPSFIMEVVPTKNKKTKKVKKLTFIGNLIEDYKKVDGQKLKEKNQKWLHDDYVKFIRFAQWKMDKVDEGIVGIITNHSFLDNPTFCGMRQSLMNTFNRIYVLDLHGSTEKKEVTPDGSKNENVFDIKQGVCISILVRKPGLERQVFHADIWGKRQDKYRFCVEKDIANVKWYELNPKSPSYLFIRQNEALASEYEKLWKITDIMPASNTTIVSKRDSLAFQFGKNDIVRIVKDIDSLDPEEIVKKYPLSSWKSRDGKVEYVKKSITDFGIDQTRFVEILYRPFDKRWTYYTPKSKGFIAWPVHDIMRHILRGSIAIMTTRLTKDDWSALAVDLIADHKAVSRYDIGYIFPLYIYKFPDEKKPKATLFEEEDPFHGNERRENFSPAFRTFIDKKYAHHYSPEEIFGYIYAVLYSNKYRQKYAEFLRNSYPRIPFVEERNVFEEMSDLGWQLLQAHLFNLIPHEFELDLTKGSDLVKKPVYNAGKQRLYINEEQYFSPVSANVWNFVIGGYQVLDKYLKFRKGRKLSLDEKENVINTIKILTFTINEMLRIDKIFFLP